MPWKHRNGRPYYYRSVREGGRVRSSYVGSGKLAELAAEMDDLGRRGRAEAVDALRARRYLLDGSDEDRAASFRQSGLLLRLTLESAGFRRHKRGEWRRSRSPDGVDAAADELVGDRPCLPARAEVLDVLTQAEAGDGDALARLREMLRANLSGLLTVCGKELAAREWSAFAVRMGVHPLRDEPAMGDDRGGDSMASGDIVLADPGDPGLTALAKKARGGDKGALAEIRRALAGRPDQLIELGGGDMGRNVELVMVNRLTGDDGLRYVAVRAKMDSLRAELEGPNPSAIERLLAERAALCWLDCHATDLEAEVESRKATDLKIKAHHDRRRERAHKRYLSALKVLAQVRKLALPAIQVNIGAQQVNVAGS